MSIIQRFKKAWMALARGLAIVNTTVLLTLIYVLLIGPISVVVRLMRKDLLHHRIGSTKSFWTPKEPVRHSLDEARHQF